MTRHNCIWGVLFQCDCGRAKGWAKVSIRTIHQHKVPFECKLCQAANPNSSREQRRTLAQAYPREYLAWKQLKKGRRNRPMRWRTFRKFLQDLGPAPPEHQLSRRDPALPHGPDNTRWSRRPTNCNVLLLNGEEVTPGFLRNHYGIRKSFTRMMQKKGEYRATEIIRAWVLRNGPQQQGDVPHRRDESLPPRKSGSPGWKGEVEDSDELP